MISKVRFSVGTSRTSTWWYVNEVFSSFARCETILNAELVSTSGFGKRSIAWTFSPSVFRTSSVYVSGRKLTVRTGFEKSFDLDKSQPSCSAGYSDYFIFKAEFRQKMCLAVVEGGGVESAD